MDKRLLAGLAAGLVALTAPVLAQDKKPVNIYIWNDYLGENTLKDFEAATGYDNHVDLYDSMELLEQKVLVGKSGYDIIVPTASPTVARLIKAGALAELDKTKIASLSGVDPVVLKQLDKVDPGNTHVLPYLGGTVGLGILPDKIKALMPDAPVDSWDLLFKPEVAKKLAPCGITILDSAVDFLPTVFHYLGLDPNSEKKEDHEKVEKLLLGIRPYVKQFVTGQNINLLAGGDACVVVGYSGDVMQAQTRAKEAGKGTNVQYVIPKEGAMAWWDTLAIPKDAPNKDGAYAFIGFVLQAKPMAAITNFVKYGNAIPASLADVEPELRSSPAVFPTEAQKAKLFTVSPVNAAVDRMRTRLWVKVKTGH
jgi:putrescine transport system substrate-binding protein